MTSGRKRKHEENTGHVPPLTPVTDLFAKSKGSERPPSASRGCKVVFDLEFTAQGDAVSREATRTSVWSRGPAESRSHIGKRIMHCIFTCCSTPHPSSFSAPWCVCVCVCPCVSLRCLSSSSQRGSCNGSEHLQNWLGHSTVMLSSHTDKASTDFVYYILLMHRHVQGPICKI